MHRTVTSSTSSSTTVQPTTPIRLTAVEACRIMGDQVVLQKCSTEPWLLTPNSMWVQQYDSVVLSHKTFQISSVIKRSVRNLFGNDSMLNISLAFLNKWKILLSWYIIKYSVLWKKVCYAIVAVYTYYVFAISQIMFGLVKTVGIGQVLFNIYVDEIQTMLENVFESAKDQTLNISRVSNLRMLLQSRSLRDNQWLTTFQRSTLSSRDGMVWFWWVCVKTVFGFHKT